MPDETRSFSAHRENSVEPTASEGVFANILDHFQSVQPALASISPPKNRGGWAARKAKQLTADDCVSRVNERSCLAANNMQPAEALIEAIQEGKPHIIKQTMRRYHIPVNPPKTTNLGAYESLLQRAVDAEKTLSAAALIKIAEKESLQALNQLLNTSRMIDGATPLHALAEKIPSKSSFDVNDVNAWRPLYLLELMVRKGADVTATNLDGKTALELATNEHARDILVKAEEARTYTVWPSFSSLASAQGR